MTTTNAARLVKASKCSNNNNNNNNDNDNNNDNTAKKIVFIQLSSKVAVSS